MRVEKVKPRNYVYKGKKLNSYRQIKDFNFVCTSVQIERLSKSVQILPHIPAKDTSKIPYFERPINAIWDHACLFNESALPKD